MVSSSIAVLISSFIFWVVYFLGCRKKAPEYSTVEVIIFYLLSRIFPLLMLPVRTQQQIICFATEWIILGMLYYYISVTKSSKMKQVILSFYLFQPAFFMLILDGQFKKMCASLFVLFILGILDLYVCKKGNSLVQFLPEYLMFGVGYSFGLLKEMNAYVLGIMGIALIAAGVRMYCLWKTPAVETTVLEETEQERRSESEVQTKRPFDKRDFICLALFTLLFAVAVFWKLGSHHTPETFTTFTVEEGGEKEIVLSFDKEVHLSKVSIYLGYKGNRKFSISDMSVGKDTWEIFEKEYTVSSAFCWNDVPVDRKLYALGMVLLEEDADICEIVCLDEQGNIYLPTNREDYPELFDEQRYYEKYVTYYDGTMFDEVYHGRTAYEFLHKLPIYEITHPPLGKSIISLGIALFGMNPFGFRVMCALFGTLMIPLMYLFAHKMFGRTEISCFAVILFGTAFMNTTLARIATLDILVAFLVLAMFYFMYGYQQALKEQESFERQMLWLFGSGMSMAFAISTKWTGFYAVAGIAILFFCSFIRQIGGMQEIGRHRRYLLKTASICVCFFILLPLIIYTLSYIPFARVYPDKGLILNMLDNAQLMLGYHIDCVFEHPYSSEWYEWLIQCRPLADSRRYLKNGSVSVVMTMLNPLLCFGGLVAFVHQFYLYKYKKCERALFLIVAYLSTLLPWLLVHRTLFIYQYFISFLFLVLMVANSLYYSHHRKRNMILFAVLSVGLYIIYYPVLTGRAIDVQWVNQVLELFEGWEIA